MLLSMKHRFLFIHTPKTGGTSIRTLLCAMGAGQLDQVCDLPLHPHSTAAQVREVLGPQLFSRLFSFAFVRNPWDLTYSTYRYILNTKGHWQHEEVCRLANFEHFLTFYYYKQMERGLGEADPARRTQMGFVCDEEGGQLVSFVGRYENLAADFRHLLGRLGLGGAPTLPHENRSTGGEYRRAYTPRMVDYVMEMRADDIRYFGYSFEGRTPGAEAQLPGLGFIPVSEAVGRLSAA